MRKILIIVLLIVVVSSCRSQLNLQDTLRGSITPERAWWDVVKYELSVEPDFNSKTIKGNNIITAKALADGRKMQIDLQQPMEITSVEFQQKKLQPVRNGNVYYITFPSLIKKGSTINLDISFYGKPREAVNPPWDGGWIWKKDKKGNPWMSVACQVLGASVWYPCKDHQSDEPDSATLSITVPDSLVGVANGRLLSKSDPKTANPLQRRGGRDSTNSSESNSTSRPGWVSYTWSVANPINNYNLIPYIGKYISWTDTYTGEKGPLDLTYYVLAENETKAKSHFTQTTSMLKCFEHWFGPYPFYEDGFKLVESPHLGMEHQSAIAYGNQFKNGYLGRDLSGTGWGEKWDFIIIHESGHEWFGNNITAKDVADMWIQEGFTNYSEALYTECLFGKEAGNEYCRGLRKNIQNDMPVIGQYGVNKEGSGDMYYKGANLVLITRQIINDDEKFRAMLRGIGKDFYHQTVTTAQIENYISKAAGRNLSKVFDQYLRQTQIPSFHYRLKDGQLIYRWQNCIPGFNMPLKITAGSELWLYPTTEWKTMQLKADSIKVDPNFYITTNKK